MYVSKPALRAIPCLSEIRPHVTSTALRSGLPAAKNQPSTSSSSSSAAKTSQVYVFCWPTYGSEIKKLEALGIASVPRWFFSFGRPVSILASISTRSRSPGQPAWRTSAESSSKTWPICRVQWPAAPSRIKGHINRSLPGFGPSTRGNDEMMVAWGRFEEVSSKFYPVIT
jgi:hypothetical protein